MQRLGIALAALAVSACQLLGMPEVDCGPVAPGACEARVRELLEAKRSEGHVNDIVKIELSDDRGSYSITFSDGTAEMMIVD